MLPRLQSETTIEQLQLLHLASAKSRHEVVQEHTIFSSSCICSFTERVQLHSSSCRPREAVTAGLLFPLHRSSSSWCRGLPAARRTTHVTVGSTWRSIIDRLDSSSMIHTPVRCLVLSCLDTWCQLPFDEDRCQKHSPVIVQD